MQTNTVQANAQPVQLRDMLANGMNPAAGQAMGGAEGFMAILMQMVMGGQMPEGDFSSMFGQPEQGAQEDGGNTEQDTTLASQMMAEFLFQQNPMLMDTLIKASGGDNALMMQAANNLGIQDLLGQKMPTDNPKARAQTFLEALQNNAAPQENVEEAQIQVLSSKQAADSSFGQNPAFGESSFRSAVMEAQKLMKSGKQGENEEQFPIDVDRLQDEVNTGKYVTAAKSKTALPESKALAEQVKTGILQNLGKGKNEFVVKLKPDGLGEITVKMVETEGRISMSIVASSNQVARMLNSELAGLRETLRPYQAEVHEVVSQSEASYQAAQDHQQFGGHQHQQQQEQQTYYYYDDNQLPAQANEMQSTLSEGLDTYI